MKTYDDIIDLERWIKNDFPLLQHPFEKNAERTQAYVNKITGRNNSRKSALKTFSKLFPQQKIAC